MLERKERGRGRESKEDETWNERESIMNKMSIKYQDKNTNTKMNKKNDYNVDESNE